MTRTIAFLSLLMTTVAVLCARPAGAEPYFALQTGQKCLACHVNPTGGGKRTAYGNAYAQMQLPARPAEDFWDGSLHERFSVGGNVRANLEGTSIPNQENEDIGFDLEEALVYLQIDLLPERLTLYLDELVAPGGATNRETYALMWFRDRSVYVKAGRMFLPYGWRLEDDSEFVRQVPGINYNTPDDGVELGAEFERTSLRLALSNGTAGGGETDSGKQISLLGSYNTPRWQVGGSFNFNDADAGDRRMQNLFGGVTTGPVTWLGEVDYIVDDGTPTGTRNQWVTFLEANIRLRRGHNLKLTYGWFDPDDDVDEDERDRYSLVWEYFPFAFTQISAGYRASDGIPQDDLQNIDQYFLQLHSFF